MQGLSDDGCGKKLVEEIKQIEFRYKGARDYIHGTDMFNEMIEVVEPTAILRNLRLTIHDYVRTTSCQLYLTENKYALNEVKDIAARCQLDIDGITHWLAISPDDRGNDVRARYSYDESEIVSLCSMIKDGINLNESSPHSFIETVVAMNKHMHKLLFPEVTGKWIFTRIDLPVYCDARESLALKLRHNINYKLTKSDIEIDGEKVGDIFFSLVKT